MQRHTFRRTEGETYIYSQRNNQAERRETYRDTHSDGQKDRHTYTIRETFRRTEGDIQRHAFRRREGQTYIYSQRNIQAERRATYRDTHSDGHKCRHTYTIIETFRRTERDTYRDTHSDGQKDRHTYTVRETFRRKEGRHTETHIQTD